MTYFIILKLNINIENENINNIKTEIYDLEDISFNNVKKLLNSLMLDFFVKEDEIIV